ncbi:head GIN domain-containing protein [Maribacter sp. ACAM166]|uniref:head GIN domain-containing protein n=1 Tax=Maribacter sp. ACAM166 TaxID=2508996 RepID=UPI0010FDC93C|nr:head GIN domain-containing protein [Maribacter sp. ACAM166]TLP82804.1 DUF2807 domain-containing protein [Maribacter sp. ACAM166]
MKRIITIVFILFSMLPCLAQNPSTQSLQKFSTLKVYDRISVTLIKAEENKLIISTVNTDEVEVLESNGVLKLKMDLNPFLAGNMIAIKLYHTESLVAIDANENAKIISNGVIKGASIEIKAQEAGIVTLDLNMETVITKSSSGSEITLSGTTGVQDATINTGGKLYNKNLLTKETMVIVLAGGLAEVHATEKAVAKVKAGGTIFIHGNPKIIEKDDTFGGTIEVIN